MTQVLNKYNIVPVTVLDVTTCVVAGRVELENGRKALLIGYGKEKKPTKPELGKYKELGYVPKKVIQVTVEPEKFETYKIGDKLENIVDKGLKVDVTGISKGKGFQGGVKRWGMKGGPKTHGQSDRHRAVGSIGTQTPGRVLKGKRMPGRMGNEKVTVKNLEVIETIESEGRTLLVLKGSVPGPNGNLVVVKLKE